MTSQQKPIALFVGSVFCWLNTEAVQPRVTKTPELVQERVSWDSQQWETTLLCRSNCLCDHVPPPRQGKKETLSKCSFKFFFKPYFLSLPCIACFSAGMASCCAFWVVSGNSDVDSLLYKKYKLSLSTESCCELSLTEGIPCFTFGYPSESQVFIRLLA